MKKWLALVLLLSSSVVFADTIAAFLSEKEEPFGLVIEIIEDNSDDWEWITPKLKNTIDQARKKYPDLQVAVVSHGKEEMALVKGDDNRQTKQKIRSLVQDDNVNFHVCATHASWYQYKPEDFVEFVNVATSGPAQLQIYTDMGFFLIQLEED
jgi:intracellular sulfur oxidation DsrE/DsrF family protein